MLERVVEASPSPFLGPSSHAGKFLSQEAAGNVSLCPSPALLGALGGGVTVGGYLAL